MLVTKYEKPLMQISFVDLLKYCILTHFYEEGRYQEILYRNCFFKE
jgi:hypothetical protein